MRRPPSDRQERSPVWRPPCQPRPSNCRTLDPDAPPWRIGIEDPHHTDRLVAVAPVHTGAVATSGTAHRGDHLVNARTGRPPAGVASVTVVAAALSWADIDATAAYAHGRD
ncbi:MAG TPA: FAD:protein FMN transferase, partial [Actinomycetes bacterium]